MKSRSTTTTEKQVAGAKPHQQKSTRGDYENTQHFSESTHEKLKAEQAMRSLRKGKSNRENGSRSLITPIPVPQMTVGKMRPHICNVPHKWSTVRVD